MNLLRCWKESLALLKPHNFKLFLLVTINAIIKAYAIVFTQIWFWVLFIARIMTTGSFMVDSIIFASIIFGFILAARPSVLKKDTHYFLRYWPYLTIFCLIIGILELLTYALIKMPFNQLTLFFPSGCLIYFFVLFFVDDSCSMPSIFKAMARAFKMLLFNLPFLIVSSLIFHTLISIVFFILVRCNFSNRIADSFITVLMMIPICYFVNFYVKKIHDNFDFYFGKQ